MLTFAGCKTAGFIGNTLNDQTFLVRTNILLSKYQWYMPSLVKIDNKKIQCLWQWTLFLVLMTCFFYNLFIKETKTFPLPQANTSKELDSCYKDSLLLTPRHSHSELNCLQPPAHNKNICFWVFSGRNSNELFIGCYIWLHTFRVLQHSFHAIWIIIIWWRHFCKQ